MRKLRRDRIRVVLATIQSINFCLLFCCLETQKLQYTTSGYGEQGFESCASPGYLCVHRIFFIIANHLPLLCIILIQRILIYGPGPIHVKISLKSRTLRRNQLDNAEKRGCFSRLHIVLYHAFSYQSSKRLPNNISLVANMLASTRELPVRFLIMYGFSNPS